MHPTPQTNRHQSAQGPPRAKIPAQPPPERLTILIDRREQTPWEFAGYPMPTKPATLRTGDYSVEHLESEAVVERKSLSDFVSCCGPQRQRFQAELDRLRGIPHRVVVIEASWADLEAGGWRGRVRPESVTASVLRWMCEGHPILLAGGREQAERCAAKFLYLAARAIYQRSRFLLGKVLEGEA